MSARPRDVYEGASNFSLRNVVQAQAMPVASRPTGGQLKFNLSGIGSTAQTPPPPSHPMTPRMPASLSMRFTALLPTSEPVAHPVIAPTMMPNLSFTSMQGAKPGGMLNNRAAIAAKQDHADAKADVMRLTAYCDDLTVRLKKSHQKLSDTEAQLHRTSQALATERHTAESQANSYRQSLSQAHEMESKLRSELSNRPKRSALTESHFMHSVGSILQDEQRESAASDKLQELEGKVRAMGDAKVLIESEIGALKELKSKAQAELDNIRCNAEELKQLKETSESTMSEKLALLQAKCKSAEEDTAVAAKALETTKSEHEALNAKVTHAAHTESGLIQTISSLNAAKVDAETECAVVKKQLQAMLTEHGEISCKVRMVSTKLDELRNQETAAQNGLTSARKRLTEAISIKDTNEEIEQSVSIAKVELEGYEAKIAQLREEISNAKNNAEAASAMAKKMVMTKSELEGCEARLSAVRSRLGESESELAQRGQRLKEIDAQVEQREALCNVPLFQLDTSAKVDASVAAAAGALVPPPPEEEEVAPVEDAVGESADDLPTQMTITGAQAPAKALCTGVHPSLAGILCTPRPSHTISALVSIDAPPNLTLQHVNFIGPNHAMFSNVGATPEAEDPTAKMVNAVVGDLKTKLLEISEQQPVWRAVAPLA